MQRGVLPERRSKMPAGKTYSKDEIRRMKASTARKRSYLRYFKKHKKSTGSAKGAKSFARYSQSKESGSRQFKQQVRGLSSGDYAAINKMRDKGK